MSLVTRPYLEQLNTWPVDGRHIMAHYDASTVVVYQAYRTTIGQFAVENQRFGGDFSFNRMSWIKPNFLWMMFRCGWGTKVDQQCVLAIRIKREAFDEILSLAVHSSYAPERHSSKEAWEQALHSSSVRLQWDPDHDPTGARVGRRAIQLGLSDEVLRKYATEWIVDIEDVSPFVADQRANAVVNRYEHLVLPFERAYVPASQSLSSRLGLDVHRGPS